MLKVCEKCSKRYTCTSQCSLAREEVLSSSQGSWKTLEDEDRTMINPNFISDEEYRDRWDSIWHGDSPIFDRDLTPRESEVFALLLTGRYPSQIARKLGVSRQYIHIAMKSIKSKVDFLPHSEGGRTTWLKKN